MKMRFFTAAALVAALSTFTLAQEEPPPGQHVLDRLEADVSLLFPQVGCGGDETGRVTPDKLKYEECSIDVEGCEAMTGYLAIPEKLPAGRKVALMFVFHGNGDGGKGRVNNVSKASSERDPVITIGVQYQTLEADGKTKFNNPLAASQAKIIEGCRWFLNKVKADHAVDPERVFVSGFSMGTGYASAWARHEWEHNKAEYPFRACFLYSSAGAVNRENCPPIPFICTVGENETAVLGTINVVASVRQFCNALAAWGKPVQYHEIPGMGHAVNGRCLQITRDVMNQLGGPGMLPYAAAEAGLPPVFEANDDPYITEVINLCHAERWSEALARIEAIEKDRSISSKERRPVRSFEKEIEKAAKKLVKETHEAIQAAIKADRMPDQAQVKRLQGILEAWPEASWIAKRGYDKTLAFIEGDFPPAVRERERKQLLLDAVALESEQGKRADAKALYEKLAARAEEDEGRSAWPRAAAYRRTWWV